MAQPLPTPETITEYVRQVAARDRPGRGSGTDEDVEFRAASARLVMHLHDTLTLGARRRLALQLRDEGDLARAREIQEELVYRAKDTLGVDDRDALALRSDLGLILFEQGELADAAALQIEVLDAYIRRYGERDLESVLAKLNLATTMKSRGEIEAALKLEEEVLDVRSITLGFRHPDTIAAAGRVGETRLQLKMIKPPETKSRTVCDAGEDDEEDDEPLV